MSTTTNEARPASFHFISATDVLMPRGNRAFGSAGEHGSAQSMPWPSVFAGALRSALLAADGDALRAFPRRPAGRLGDVIGTPGEPGSFRLRWLSFARRNAAGRVEPVLPLPADRIVFRTEGRADRLALRALRPWAWPAGLYGSGELPMQPLLRGAPAGKPVAGSLSGHDALRAYLDDADAPAAVAPAPSLLRAELRLGIALDADKRTASEGALYTTEALRFARRGEPLHGGDPFDFDAGYLVSVEGAEGVLPAAGLLRLGGDGRSARYEAVAYQPPAAAIDRIERNRRFRLVLLTPALWARGSRPPRLAQRGAEHWLELDGYTARLACAVVPRAEVVSGWDMAAAPPRPKRAQRAAPSGSVYWFDRAEGDPRKLADWVAGGVWAENADTMRRAEGFNNALLAAWKE